MLRRLHPHQPASFAFTPENLAWAESQIAKYPPGRQASAVIPLLWRAQEQEGWLTRPAIETVARMLGMAEIRALEVATFYFMFQLAPVGSVAHVQVCGTLSCMLMGAEELVGVCRARIAKGAHELSPCGRFSWEEVECLGACANAPMAQIGKDYYEDLTPQRLEAILDAFAAGEVPQPGPQTGRWASEPAGGLTSLTGAPEETANASVALALRFKDTVARITGAPLSAPAAAAVTSGVAAGADAATAASPARAASASPPSERVVSARPPDDRAGGVPAREDRADGGLPPGGRAAAAQLPGAPDDLTVIKGIGPKLAAALNARGVFHLAQFAGMTAAEIAELDEALEGFKGRASRDDWAGQARRLIAEKEH